MNNYTEQELEISNKSYTNKDFNTIYPELLDLVKKLTNKWDPTTSNESDPGVVLLKLWAILADKNNYNIDKNILETFPLSVTQRANALRLYDMLGYNMHYYQSAITELSFWYIGDVLSKSDGKISRLTVPRFTMVTDDSGQNVFTILDDVIFSSAAAVSPAQAIQGTIHDYEVNGVSDITLDNLDSEYRLFFTESRIAENGIFIANKGESTLNYDAWRRVTNLESATLNSKVFKFGVLPNTQSCYIQFPQDIGTLIGNGLKIKYIISDGFSGNIPANRLTTFRNEVVPYELTDPSLQDDEFYKTYYNASINADVTIKNVYSVTNGADPEDLDSAYKNYKKTIGTFNTLVTTDDYEKAIYSLIDDLGLPLCSNVVVSDRTNDINYSTNVVTLDSQGNVTYQLHVDSDSKEIIPTNSVGDPINVYDAEGDEVDVYVTTPKMSAFDLGLYILNPMIDIDDETGYYYDKSFSVATLYDDILTLISDPITENTYYKSAEHDFIETLGIHEKTYDRIDEASLTDGALPYIFKNFYRLNGKIVTYYKVTENEAEDIEDNIKKALFKNFNARKVNFGLKILYEDIVSTIEKADSRIKTVILNEPEYDLRYMLGDDYSGGINSAIPLPITSGDDTYRYSSAQFTQSLLYNLLLKMIVSGHVLLYEFNKQIKFDFGQTQLKKYSGFDYITTEFPISLSSDSSGTPADILSGGYEVSENLNVILYAPNFYTKASYGAFVNYSFDSSLEFASNTYYKLPSNGLILLEYTDENGVLKHPIIPAGSCIRFVDSRGSSSTLKMTNITIDKTIDNQDYAMCTLTANLSIEVIDVNLVTFPSESIQSVLYCMWFTNKSRVITKNNKETVIEYELFGLNEHEKLLQDNEYFIYTNHDRNELVILGSGTLLVRPKNTSSPAIRHKCSVPVQAIVDNGQSAVSDSDWYRYNLVSTGTYTRGLALVELLIVTLGKGAGVKVELFLNLEELQQELEEVLEQLKTATEATTPKKSDLEAQKRDLEVAISNYKISNKPIKVINPQYCEDFNANPKDWVPLTDYLIGDAEDPTTGINYHKGWSIISRFNLSTNSIKNQEIPENASIKFSVLNPTTGLITQITGDNGTISGNNALLILSNAILAFGGGELLEVTNSSKEPILIYSYQKANLPSYVAYASNPTNDTKNFERVNDSLIIHWKDWIRRYDATNSKYTYDTGDTNRPSADRLFPLSFSTTGSLTLFLSKVAVTLVGENTQAKVRVGQTDYILNKDKPVAYIELPPGSTGLPITEFKQADDITLPTSFDYETAADALIISYPLLVELVESGGELVPKFSDQVLKTLGYIRFSDLGNASFAQARLVSDIQEKFSDFNILYNVLPQDAIDGEATTSNNFNNLFAPDLIWDKNHICNKYTIPQYDYKNSSVKVAQVYIKK